MYKIKVKLYEFHHNMNYIIMALRFETSLFGWALNSGNRVKF